MMQVCTNILQAILLILLFQLVSDEKEMVQVVDCDGH